MYSSLLEEHKNFECLIHGDDEPLHLGPRLSSATKCNHDPNVCIPCLKDLLEKSIREGRFGDIRCPDTECRATIAFQDIRNLVSTAIFKT